MKKKRFFLAKKVGIFLLLTSFILLPVWQSMSFAAEIPPAGPTTETTQDRDRDAAGGDAGPGAAKGLKRSTWLWIGGGVVALAAIIAAAGGGSSSSSNH